MTQQDSKAGQLVREKSSLWIRIKKRIQRKGVVEIDVDHHRYKMLNYIREGLNNLHANHQELGPKDDLVTEDYTHVLSKTFRTRKGKTYTFSSYASSVFASIRQAVNIGEEEYFSNIAPPQFPYLEFISNSKSGQDFFLSHDQQYILKTDRSYSIQFFLSFLGEYLEHFQMYPHSLIVKFIGLYSIEMPDSEKVYMLSMQNIFYPPQRIDIRFDVKGCFGGRYQKPSSADSKAPKILKDKNFDNERICLEGQSSWFEKQLQIDVEFFRELGVQDYSLLIGRHKLQRDEKISSFHNVVKRVKLSLARKRSSTVAKTWSVKKVEGSTWHINPEVPSTNQTPSTTGHLFRDNSECSLPGVVEHTQVSHEPQIKRTLSKKRVLSFRNLLDSHDPGMESFEISNMRLLPNCQNPLHVIDGPEFRYYVGIIDFFTQYECRQRTARVLKTVKYRSLNHSTVPPDNYADRFLQFIMQRIK